MDDQADESRCRVGAERSCGQTYRMKIARKGDTITVWDDDQQLASMTDPNPLSGSGHDHLAVDDWDAELWTDNLKITPL